jgi:serine/threonine protein kinase
MRVAIMSILGEEAKISIGTVLDGKYEITGVLGEGAMGVVYVARHKRLQRTVALKTLRSEFAAEAELIERFEREARAASAIGHPNIVQVFDAGGDLGGTPYLVMEYLEGQSLGDLLYDHGALEIGRSIDICCQVLAGLGAAHSAGILHRDLKPDNIFITSDAQGQELVKILDFGISKVLSIADPSIIGDSRATRVGTVLGTPLYMSPEQAGGRADLDLRADLWAVVCVLYECVTGKTPFNGDNYNQILAAVMQGIFVGLRDHRPEVPSGLHELVQRGLKVERDDRYPDATSLSVALTSIEVGKFERKETSDEPNMLAAFDNLADRFIEQEREDSVDIPIPTASPGTAKTPVPHSAPSLDRFAPPESNEVLSLDLETDPAAPGPRTTAAKPFTAPGRKSRARSQVVTRQEPSRVGAIVGKSILAILLVAGVGAGYRYYKFGHVLPQPKAVPAHLVIEVHPNGTQVYLNDVLTEERELDLVNGSTYAVRLTATDRLEMLGEVTAQPGDKIRISEKMWHKIFRINPSVVAAVKDLDLDQESAEVIDAAYTKIEAFGDCGERLLASLTEVLADDERGALPRQLTDECVTTFDIAIAAEPKIETLDKASSEFRDALSNFGQAVIEEQRSKGAGAKASRGRTQQRKSAARVAQAKGKSWATAMSNLHARSMLVESMRADQSGGDPLHRDVRKLAVATDAWMRTHLAGGRAKLARAAMVESFSVLSKSASRRTAEFKESGVTGYLNSLRPIIDKDAGDDAVLWHNQSVEVFNKLRLPLQIAVDSADQ